MNDLRRSFGMTGQQVLSVSGNPNELVILTTWPSADQARAFASSPELKQGLQKAGVITQPEILILEEPGHAQELAQRVVSEIEAQDFAAARALLSDDFKFSGAVPVPIGPDEWLGVHRALTARDGKLTGWAVESLPNGGVLGILAQMGAAVPAH